MSTDRHSIALVAKAVLSIEAARLLATQEGMAGFAVSEVNDAPYVAESLLAEQGLDL